MALVSRCDQTIQLADEGPLVVTPGSRTQREVQPHRRGRAGRRAGWRIEQRWHDTEDHLSPHLLQPADEGNSTGAMETEERVMDKGSASS